MQRVCSHSRWVLMVGYIYRAVEATRWFASHGWLLVTSDALLVTSDGLERVAGEEPARDSMGRLL